MHGQLNREVFPCPRSRVRIWFRETGLVVPSRVSLLILYTNAEYGSYSRDSSRCPRRHPYILASTTHHRVSPEFIGSRNCVPMTFTAESPLGTAPVVLKVARVTSAAFASPWTKYYCAPLFSHTHYWYTVSMFKLSGVYQNISTLLHSFFLPNGVFPTLCPRAGFLTSVYYVRI